MYNATEAELATLFKHVGKVGEIMQARIFKSRDGSFNGTGVIEFVDREQALGALHLNGEFFLGQSLQFEMRNKPTHAEDIDFDDDLFM